MAGGKRKAKKSNPGPRVEQESEPTPSPIPSTRPSTEGSANATHVAAHSSPQDAVREQGNEAFKSGDYKMAFEKYSQVLDMDSTDVKALNNRCAAALKLSRFDIAHADATAVLAKEPDNARACARLSRACLGTGDVTAAVRWATTAASIEPTQFRTAESRMKGLQQEVAAAQAHMDKGDSQAAVVSARRALSLAEGITLVETSTILARGLIQQGQGEEAVHVSRDALQADSSCLAALRVHAEALVLIGNVAKALQVYSQLMRSDPDNSQVARAYKRCRALDNGKEAGNAAFKAGKYSRSLDAGTELKNTYIAQVATNRANACIKLRKYTDAVADADLAIAADKDFAKAYLRRAQAREALGSWQDVVRDYQRVQELDASLPGIADKLKHAKLELKKASRVDYYKLLDVGRDAGEASIKKAFKRKALKEHPDKVPAEDRLDAEARFKLIVEAHDMLTDSEKRAKYDAGWSKEEIEQGFQEGMRGGFGCGGMSGMDMEEMLFAAMFARQHGSGMRYHM